ncbi:MAG: hypothetical protein QF685_03280 [Verrucomicrobiota bacterium]|jgi:hypothetical protein|nr:hypothetical protein [Verrucomicrobiota bacterium]
MSARIFLLLLLMTIVSSSQAADRAVIDAIKNAGGLALPHPGKGEQWEVEFHLRGRELTDEGLRHVAALKNVVVLNLRDTRITSAGLVHLKGLSKLRRLHLERTQIDDAGIGQLAGLGDLEYLNLYGTKITDKALDQLVGLKNLKQLYVWQTKVTEAGIEKLKKTLPNVKVVRGIDLSKVVAVKKPEPKPEYNLKWLPAEGKEKPPSKSQAGSFTIVTFQNKSDKNVKLYWIDYGGARKLYGEIAKGGERQQNTYSDAVWLVTDEKDKPMGYFVAGTKMALAIIPK